MRLLLDSHAIQWSLADQAKLSPTAQSAIRTRTNEIYVSVVSAWEMAIKVGLGKWPAAAMLVDRFEHETAANGFSTLPISVPHVRAAGLLHVPHRDPFDRLLVAQAQIEGLTLVTADIRIQSLGVAWLW